MNWNRCKIPKCPLCSLFFGLKSRPIDRRYDLPYPFSSLLELLKFSCFTEMLGIALNILYLWCSSKVRKDSALSLTQYESMFCIILLNFCSKVLGIWVRCICFEFSRWSMLICFHFYKRICLASSQPTVLKRRSKRIYRSKHLQCGVY